MNKNVVFTPLNYHIPYDAMIIIFKNTGYCIYLTDINLLIKIKIINLN